MTKYRTAQGKLLDMGTLVAKNERVRAVGNLKVNARGDTIDATGRIVEPVTSKVNNQYAKTVGNRSAQPTKPPRSVINTPRKGNDPLPVMENPLKEELTEQEKQLEFEMEDDFQVEKIKSKQIKNGK